MLNLAVGLIIGIFIGAYAANRGFRVKSNIYADKLWKWARGKPKENRKSS